MAKYGDLIRKARANTGEPAEPETTEQESTKAETIVQDTRKQDSILKETFKMDTIIQVGGNQESYAKVAMRLSVEAVEKLKLWRLQTGLPYEILVDVLIRGQDAPTRSQLEEARRIRQQRLLEGKKKALDSTQKKLDS